MKHLIATLSIIILAGWAIAQNTALTSPTSTSAPTPALAVTSTGMAAVDEPAWESGMAMAQTLRATFAPKRGASPFRITRPLVAQPSGGSPFLALDIDGDSGGSTLPMVEYSGPPGTTFLRVRGLNSSRWQDISVRLLTEGTSAFRVATNGPWQSASLNTFERVRVETYAKGTVGWEVAPEGKGGSDISCNRWVSCIVNGDNVHNGGFAGWLVGGGNTLANMWENCGASFQTGYAWRLGPDNRWDPPHGGGDASLIVNPICSYDEGTLSVQSGFKVTVVAGRTEWARGPVFLTGAGSAVGRVAVLNHRVGPECKTFSKAVGSTPVVEL